MNVVIFFTAAIVGASGLECFTSHDERSKTCSNNPPPYYVDNVEECCDSIKAVAYSNLKPKENESVSCTSCKQVRVKVHCFQEIYWIGERSCHEVHTDLVNLLECCVFRGAKQKKHAEGFSETLVPMNSTIPTYRCTPCVEAVVIASDWSVWGPCNATCGGGYREREKICNEEKVSPTAICYGNKFEIENCNDHPCPPSDSSASTALIVTTVILAIVLFALCCAWFLYKGKICHKKSNRFPAIDSAVYYRNSMANRNGENQEERSREIKAPPQTPRYQMGRRILPSMPPTDLPEPLEEVLKKSATLPLPPSVADNPESHTYASIDKTYYSNQNEGYISMDVRHN